MGSYGESSLKRQMGAPGMLKGLTPGPTLTDGPVGAACWPCKGPAALEFIACWNAPSGVAIVISTKIKPTNLTKQRDEWWMIFADTGNSKVERLEPRAKQTRRGSSGKYVETYTKVWTVFEHFIRFFLSKCWTTIKNHRIWRFQGHRFVVFERPPS